MSLSDRQHTTTAHARIHGLSHGEALPPHEWRARQLRNAADSPVSFARANLRRRRVSRSLRIGVRTLMIRGIFMI